MQQLGGVAIEGLANLQACRGVEIWQFAEEPLEFCFTGLIPAGAELFDDRTGVAVMEFGHEAARLLFHDRQGSGDLPLPLAAVGLTGSGKVFDGVEPHARTTADRGIEVTGDGEVENHEGATATGRLDARVAGDVDHRFAGAGRAHDQIRHGQLFVQA